ncbi:xanthine dehydrogenase family protein molybdopterin-binding subunit [Vallicoccus soli]|uniref:Xanthine dehydrogenase family protein molybdopterin-binding subunit n=1 Tax=Vallicoccus soli TaxID=2339232 RepID=A0A3A3Z1G3_9ACTN|nr:xanthine dehydrogenase family protein molybdopterin-binding subunit [Vallicoccus soli]RJK97095.1 xanthine dehydrogenase family protein molybdopterin-binding subunit [Vallicoccus soli]
MSVVGEPRERVDARDKVSGRARYAAEQRLGAPGERLHGWIVQSTVARGRVRAVDAAAARAVDGVVAVLTHEDAPRLAQQPADGELAVLQSPEVAYRGQVVGLVVAVTLEAAREGARALRIAYEEAGHDVRLRGDHPGLYAPEQVNPAFPTDTAQGDLDGALAAAAHVVDATYSTPALFNNPLEPHASTAAWEGDALTVHDSTQGTSGVAASLAEAFGVAPEHVRVLAAHVGGGFGSKGSARPNVVLAAMAARVTGRPVTVTTTREMQFALVGYRTPTLQRVRLGADGEGRLQAVGHDVVEQTSTVFEFAEQTAEPTRHQYAGPHRRTSHRLSALDVPTPRWMRAPGECPGMYALEAAMDELAGATGLDPVELRLRNDTPVDPESGRPFSSRHLRECLLVGAQRFGWWGRDPRPGARREGRWLVGTGVAASTYPAMAQKCRAVARARPDGTYEVGVNATDIGTGARTVLGQIAADALRTVPERVVLRIADSDLPPAPVAGGSAGTASWGWAVVRACEQLLREVADGVPAGGAEARSDTQDEIEAQLGFVRQGFGAVFAEARVDLDSGEVRVPRLHGTYALGRVMNARTAHSQLVGGMTMGLSMALHEGGHLDEAFGDWANHDLAEYHVASHADVLDVDAVWLEEVDEHLNPLGGKGIGEIGIVGTAAAVANAVHHATGVRVRDLPITPDTLLEHLPER